MKNTVKFTGGAEDICLDLDLTYPILISIKEHSEGSYEPVFEELLCMPVGMGCRDAYGITHQTMPVFAFRVQSKLFEMLNGQFIPSANFCTQVGDDRQSLSLYVDPHLLLKSIKKTSSNSLIREMVEALEKMSVQLETKNLDYTITIRLCEQDLQNKN